MLQLFLFPASLSGSGCCERQSGSPTARDHWGCHSSMRYQFGVWWRSLSGSQISGVAIFSPYSHAVVVCVSCLQSFLVVTNVTSKHAVSWHLIQRIRFQHVGEVIAEQWLACPHGREFQSEEFHKSMLRRLGGTSVPRDRTWIKALHVWLTKSSLELFNHNPRLTLQ